jgi:hypothetical protein
MIQRLVSRVNSHVGCLTCQRIHRETLLLPQGPGAERVPEQVESAIVTRCTQIRASRQRDLI